MTSMTPSATTPTEVTYPRKVRDWLRVSKQMGDLVYQWAPRHDVLTQVSDHIAGEIAYYTPMTNLIEISGVKVFGQVRDLDSVPDLSIKRNWHDYPHAIGTIFHETSHVLAVKQSLLDEINATPERESEVWILLEETRSERIGLDAYPEMRRYLRSVVLKFILSKPPEEFNTTDRTVNFLALLVMARKTLGVLSEDDVQATRKILLTIVDPTVLQGLEALWTEYQSLDVRQTTVMHRIVQDWNALLDSHGVETAGGSSESSDLSELLRSLLGELMDGARRAANTDELDHAEEQAKEDQEVRRAQERKELEESRQRKSDASSVYGGNRTPRTSSTLVRSRNPNTEEQAAATVLSRKLSRAKYRDRQVRRTSSSTPPGRLRMGSAMQGSVMRSQGRMDTSQPWRAKRRVHTDTPDFTVGVIVDISGSMGGVMAEMASTAWVLAEAVNKIQGTASVVYMGNDAFPVLRPGERQKQVQQYSAADGTECFELAFRALDGRINLVGGSGARLLLVVSDGNYTSKESLNAQRLIPEALKDGVVVVLLGHGSSKSAERLAKETGALYYPISNSITKDMDAIGDLAARALTAASARQGRG